MHSNPILVFLPALVFYLSISLFYLFKVKRKKYFSCGSRPSDMLLNLLFLPVSFSQFIPATHKDTMELIHFIRAVETNQTVSCLLAKNILSPSLKRTTGC